MTDKPSKVSGQMHATKGNVKETVGKTFGATGTAQEGRQEHVAGEAEKVAAKQHTQGTKDRALGKKDEVVGATTQDRSQQVEGDVRRAKGQQEQSFSQGI